jgi:predicted metal-dependent enzyme (double-stranded beta helix superfamily)
LNFDIDQFVAACHSARREADAPARIAALVAQAISDPAAIAAAIQQRRAGQRADEMAEVFVSDDELTIYQVSFPSNLFGVPHDHAGWAVIGVYSGVEAFNIYEERNGKLEQTGRMVLSAPAVEVLEPGLIHDIDNPSNAVSGSIHVYSNRHFDMPGRRIWRDGTDAAEAFTLERSFRFGMERTARRRRELGLPELAAPHLPDVERVRRSTD